MNKEKNMKSLKELIEELERIISMKFEVMEGNIAMSMDKVIAIAPEGLWEKKLGLNGYIEVSISDFCPEVVRYSAEAMHEVVYMKYNLPRPVRTLSGKETREVSYKAVPFLAIVYLLKKFYGIVYIYLNIERLAPLIIRPHKLGEDKGGYEGLIAPKFI